MFAAPNSFDLLFATIGLVAMIFVGVVAIIWADRWRKHAMRPPSNSDDVTTYRVLRDEGLLKPDEYRQIRERLRRK